MAQTGNVYEIQMQAVECQGRRALAAAEAESADRKHVLRAHAPPLHFQKSEDGDSG